MSFIQIIVGCFALLIFTGLGIGNDKDDNSDDDEKTKKKNISPYSEEEMDEYSLEEWQKDLVREGRYAPWSFKKKSTSSDELSEDQYYEDDDV